MRIVVCIKPVRSEFVYPNEERQDQFVMNPYDLYTLERCIQLKRDCECEVISLCMGSQGSKSILIKTIALGVDQAILLNDIAFSGSDTVATSYVLWGALKKIGYTDIIAFGEKALDGETGQVVYGLSERMNYRCVTQIEDIVDLDDDTIIVKQNTKREIVKMRLKLPVAVAFCDFRLTQPQISLLAMKRARKKEISIWNAADLYVDVQQCGLSGSKTKVLEVKNELIKKKNVELVGSVESKATFLFHVLRGGNPSKERYGVSV
ncbi:MAG: electron transfer flavoprotein subunit beta/FixA family protein [Oscillospiraceae bacterium]|jgi:electron transfer flavoprotein beta subunit|nr:electron transfer flavoprotein subunit beta/FixA family protein [Oscillospiraceae bacterium]